jgi:myosin-9
LLFQSEGGGRVFGAELTMLIDEETVIPTVIEKLLMIIELRALYIEGVYRKSGSVAQVRQLRKIIETTPSRFDLVLIFWFYHRFADFDTLTFEDTPMHVVSTLVKAFFRELPEPLMTFDLYENFLNVSGILSKLWW